MGVPTAVRTLSMFPFPKAPALLRLVQVAQTGHFGVPSQHAVLTHHHTLASYSPRAEEAAQEVTVGDQRRSIRKDRARDGRRRAAKRLQRVARRERPLGGV
jgi:hypothetical protein